jgi:hypothetical protein
VVSTTLEGLTSNKYGVFYHARDPELVGDYGWFLISTACSTIKMPLVAISNHQWQSQACY